MWIAALLFSCAVYAEKFAYPPQKISSKGLTSIKISGVKGRLILKERATKFYRIKVMHSKDKKFEDWNLSADRVHDALVLEVFNVSAGKQWQKIVKQERWPEFDIELEGPSVPALIAWREGKIEIAGWSRSVELSFLNGSVITDRTRGPLKLEAVDAQVKIKNHRGELDLRGERGAVEIGRMNGQARIVWIDGTFKADSLKGEYNLDWQNGQVTVRDLNAKIKGKSVAADWDLKARSPSEVDLHTESGGAQLRWLAGGVHYFLSSAPGKVMAKSGCPVKVQNGFDVCEGKRPGQPMGEVFVQSKSGIIRWQNP
jgi:hypothetical protein